jgi:uncharacterized protein
MDPATTIRRTRDTTGLTQHEFARRVGTSQPALSSYERGSRTPSSETLRRIVRASGVRPSDLLAAHRDDVVAVCERHGATDVRVIGSVARAEDTADSDLDLLVRFRAGATLLDLAALVRELEDLLGRDVDVLSEAGLRLPGDEPILAEARAL